MLDLGIRLQLMIGSSKPAPAPYEVVDALREVEVRNNDSERDGFSLTFTLGRRGAQQDFPLLKNGQLDPPARVTIIVFLQAMPAVLINGMITRHQVVPSTQAGQSVLKVIGEDTSLQMDRKRKKATFRNLSDQGVVKKILEAYPDLRPDTAATNETPPETERITSQQDTDLAFINKLAQRNGFRFYTEATAIPGVSTAYWGPRDRSGLPVQRPLTINMGPQDNVTQLSFGYDALAAVTPEGVISDPVTKQSIPISPPSPLESQLSSQPEMPLRTTSLDDTAGLNPIQAILHMLTSASSAASAASGSGQLDTVRYGAVLRSRQKVEVRGAGKSQDGEYYVSQVTHQILPGQYKQLFNLLREGRGATSSRVKGAE